MNITYGDMLEQKVLKSSTNNFAMQRDGISFSILGLINAEEGKNDKEGQVKCSEQVQ